MKPEITIPYTIILNRLNRNSYKGEIEINKARKILSHYFRFPKSQIGRMFTELKSIGVISINKKFIKIHGGFTNLEDAEEIEGNERIKYYL